MLPLPWAATDVAFPVPCHTTLPEPFTFAVRVPSLTVTSASPDPLMESVASWTAKFAAFRSPDPWMPTVSRDAFPLIAMSRCRILRRTR